MSIRSHWKTFWSTWTIASVLLCLVVGIGYSLGQLHSQSETAIVEVRAAVKGLEVVGGGIARIEIQVDSVNVRLEDIATLKAKLDSCKRGL